MFWSNLAPHFPESTLFHNLLSLALTSCTVFLKRTEYWIPLTIPENSMYTIGRKIHQLLYPTVDNLHRSLNSGFLFILEWSDLYPDKHMYSYFKTYSE